MQKLKLNQEVNVWWPLLYAVLLIGIRYIMPFLLLYAYAGSHASFVYCGLTYSDSPPCPSAHILSTLFVLYMAIPGTIFAALHYGIWSKILRRRLPLITNIFIHLFIAAVIFTSFAFWAYYTDIYGKGF